MATSLGPLQQIDAGPMDVGYAEAGPAGGPAVVLLHGWPYDIHSYADVAPLLASRGYRVIVPFARQVFGVGAGELLGDERHERRRLSNPSLQVGRHPLALAENPLRF
jgi:pimeloyl-ACP methyl ester carboxylesterase